MINLQFEHRIERCPFISQYRFSCRFALLTLVAALFRALMCTPGQLEIQAGFFDTARGLADNSSFRLVCQNVAHTLQHMKRMEGI